MRPGKSTPSIRQFLARDPENWELRAERLNRPKLGFHLIRGSRLPHGRRNYRRGEVRFRT